jgi:hypothetical protein
LEAKSYATSWTLGGTTRNAETLTIPTAGVLYPSQGTILCRFYMDANLNAPTRTYVLWSHQISSLVDNINRITLQINSGGIPVFRVTTGDAAGATSTPQTALAAQPGVGWHTAAVRWSSTDVTLYLDGVSVATQANPKIPAAISYPLTIGSNSGGAFQANTPIDSLQVFNQALPDALMARYTTNAPTYPTDKTTLFLPFTNSIAKSFRVMSTNYTIPA